jgi:hypothetical protein
MHLYIDPYLVAVQGVRYGVPSYTTATLGWLSFDLVLEVPEAFETPDEPLVLHHQNTYHNVKLYLSPAWTQYLRRSTADVYFVMKRYQSTQNEYFRVKGILREADNVLEFPLNTTETDRLPPGLDVYWEMTVAKGLATEFFRVIINGRVHVEPTLRRIN